jgi:hypothetical protein
LWVNIRVSDHRSRRVRSILAIWSLPHTFGLIPLEGDPAALPPLLVYTRGPLVADLAALVDPNESTVLRLGRTLGFEWVSSLVEVNRHVSLGEPALMTFLRDEYGLRSVAERNPYGRRGGEFVRRRPTTMPKRLLAEFAASEAERLALIGRTMRQLAAPLLSTARGRPRPGARQQQRAADLLNALDTAIRVDRFYDPLAQQTVYRMGATNLYARALLELIELYDDQPLVAICARCRRLYLPRRRSEQYCRRYIWPANGGALIAGCVYDDNQTPIRVPLDGETHRREYKRYQVRISRLVRDVGPDAARTREAQAEFNLWKRTHPIARGRPPTAEPTSSELLPYPARNREAP